MVLLSIASMLTFINNLLIYLIGIPQYKLYIFFYYIIFIFIYFVYDINTEVIYCSSNQVDMPLSDSDASQENDNLRINQSPMDYSVINRRLAQLLIYMNRRHRLREDLLRSARGLSLTSLRSRQNLGTLTSRRYSRLCREMRADRLRIIRLLRSNEQDIQRIQRIIRLIYPNQNN